MSKDHYVAQTYLKHFLDPGSSGQLHVYKKQDLKYFPSGTKPICKKINWDSNEYFPDNPRLMDEYLKEFEPKWNEAVERISKGISCKKSKYYMSGYIAALTVRTPAMFRQQKKLIEHNLETRRLAEAKRLQENPDGIEDVDELISGLLSPDIKLEIDPEYVKARAMQTLTTLLWTFYRSDWHVLFTNNDMFYLTSDNPSCLLYLDSPLYASGRFVPITPKLAVIIETDINIPMENIPDPAVELPDTLIKFGAIKKKKLHSLNTLVVQSAEEIIISPRRKKSISKLVRKYRNWRVDNTTERITTKKGYTDYSQSKAQKVSKV